MTFDLHIYHDDPIYFDLIRVTFVGQGHRSTFKVTGGKRSFSQLLFLSVAKEHFTSVTLNFVYDRGLCNNLDRSATMCLLSRSKIIPFDSCYENTHTHTQQVDCSTWTTPVGNYPEHASAFVP